MRTKKAYLLSLGSGLLTAALVAGAGLALKHDPHFYHAGDFPPSSERKHLSIKFVADFAQMLADARVADQKPWEVSFTESGINSFFQEDLVSLGEAENLRKLGISEPRVAFEQDRIRFAFRYGSGFWSTVVSYDVRVWAVPNEPNVLAVKFLGRRAGALPISVQSLLAEVTELAARQNIEVSAYRHEGHPVALFRFQADQAHPTAHLSCVRSEPGKLTIRGACGTAAGSARVAKALAPAGN
jgi:hypothetical protein